MVVAEVVENVASKVLEVPFECYISFFGLDDGGVWLVIVLLIFPLTFLFLVFLFNFDS